MKYGVIYKHTNKINGKSYIGQTTRENTEKRFSKSDSTYRNYKTCPAFFPALQKYTWDNFETEILVSCFDQDYLNKMEEYYIHLFNALAPHGYNTNAIIEGNVKLSDSTKAKIGAKQKAYRNSLEIKPAPINKKEHIFINGIEHKNCPDCKQNKVLNQFVTNSKRWDGLGTYCKECHNAYRKQYKYEKLSLEELQKSYENRSESMSQGQLKYFKNNPKRRQEIAKAKSKAIIATNTKTGETLEFESAKDAKQFGFDNTNIGIAIKNSKAYKGYTWKFK